MWNPTGKHMKVPTFHNTGDFEHDLKCGFGILVLSNGEIY